MARALAARRPVTLVEYGREQHVDLTDRDVGEVAEIGERWKRALHLRSNPLKLKRVSPRRFSLRAEGVTGIINAGPLYIEVVPKFLEDPTSDDDWSRALWNVLTVVHEVPPTPDPASAGPTSDDSFVDLLARSFMASLNAAAIRGFPRGYVEVRRTEPVLRGSLDTSRAVALLVRPWEVPCKPDLLTEDMPVNRLLRWALHELSTSVRSPERVRSLNEAMILFAGTHGPPPSILDARRLTLGPQHSALDPALRIATMLLERKMLRPRDDREELSGFLWASSDVFESFVRRISQLAAARLGRRAVKKTSRLAGPIEAPRPLLTTPDVQIVQRGRPVLLVDAKYKTARGLPAAADAYQVIAGGKALGCSEVLLVYPQIWGEAPATYRWRVAGEGSPVRLATVSLDLRRMRTRAGTKELADQMEEVLRTGLAS